MNVPFTPEEFLAVIAEYNAGVWPMQVVFYVLAAFMLYWGFRSGRSSDRLLSGALALLWGWMGVAYHWLYFSAINPAAWVFGAFFMLQAAAFVAAGVVGARLRFRFRTDGFGITGAIFVAYALLLYPLFGAMAGHAYPDGPTFGLPCPTTIATFGLLLWATRPVPLWVLPVPLVWSLIGTSAAFQFGVTEDYGLLVAGVVGTIMVWVKNRRLASYGVDRDPGADLLHHGDGGASPRRSGETGMDRYLEETRLVDYTHPSIERLVRERGWRELSDSDCIAAIYDFVRNEIEFGYNRADNIPASEVVADGMGQCNTKGTLFMALLRACGVPCRFHAFTIDKELQKGAIQGLAYRVAPADIIHSWVEVWHGGDWLNLEGFILDEDYLASVQEHFADQQGEFSGYAIATTDLHDPPVEWEGCDTYIQKEGINRDLGRYDAPDEFYEEHGTNDSGLTGFVFRNFLQDPMNENVARIRRRDW